MIEIRFEERVKIGLQYVLESLHGSLPLAARRDPPPAVLYAGGAG